MAAATRCAAALPLVGYFVLLAYAGYAASVTGHWPYYAHPDPKQLPLDLLLYIVGVFMLVGALSLVLVPAGYGAWRMLSAVRKRPVAPHAVWIVVYCVGAVLWIADYSAVHTQAPWPSMIDWLLD